MNREYTRVFRDPSKLEEMVLLRKQGGWNLSQLARYFEVDHTTIRHHCVKFQLIGVGYGWRTGEIRELPPAQQTAVPTPDEKDWYTNEWGERVSKGKSYRQIRADAAERRSKQTPTLVIYTNWKSQNGYF